jgi:nucleoside-diphosphate-sugar epimerase
MKPHVLVTGATGFVGAALVLELLEQTEARVTCLVRDRDGVPPLERLRSQLLQAMAHYESGHLEADMIGRVDALVGDLTDPDLAAAAPRLGPLDAVWHSAASLKFRDRDADEIRLHNVQGAAHIVALAEAAGAQELNHISTAYVSGRRSGLIPEEPVPAGTETNNQYERSKVDGEAIMAGTSMHHRVFRPSIVIGHSRTLAADSSMGVYGFLREMDRFARAVRDPADLPTLTIHADTKTGINLIPVDLVASSAVAIARSDTTAHYFHLTNGEEAIVRECIPIVCEQFGLPAPKFTTDGDELTRIDKMLSRFLEFYLPYLGGERRFDRTNTDSVVGPRCDYPSGSALATALVQTYLADQQAVESTSGVG